MKKLSYNLRAAVIVLLLTFTAGAFAFTQIEQPQAKSQDVGWYKTNPDGTILIPHESVTPSEFCEGSLVYCAKQYNLVEGEPVSETDADPIMRD